MWPEPDFPSALLEELKGRGANPVCEICAHNDWVVMDIPLELVFSDSLLKLPHRGIPTGATICKNCGNVRLFSLSTLGLCRDGG